MNLPPRFAAFRNILMESSLAEKAAYEPELGAPGDSFQAGPSGHWPGKVHPSCDSLGPKVESCKTECISHWFFKPVMIHQYSSEMDWQLMEFVVDGSPRMESKAQI